MERAGGPNQPLPKIPFSSDYYRFHDTGLSGIVQHAYQAPQIPLRWIQQTAAACGLAMKEQVQPKPDAHLAPVRDSFKEFMYGIYAVARFAQRYHRPIGRTTVNETVDESVLKRRDQDPGYRPPGLERYLAR